VLTVERNLAGFTGAGYDKGRSVVWQALWFAVLNVIFVKWWCPPRVRPLLLRAFGAKVGRGVLIRHRVRVHWPWKLTIGDATWIGEDAWLMNLEPLTVGANVCISQGARLICGSHDRRSPTFEFDNGPIVVGDGVWVAAGCTVLRGAVIGDQAVLGAGTVVRGTVEPGALVTR
jgi:putative colanic acid biosynthesis acetyltransferase WcaF